MAQRRVNGFSFQFASLATGSGVVVKPRLCPQHATLANEPPLNVEIRR